MSRQDQLRTITIFYGEEDEEKILKLAREAEAKFTSTSGESSRPKSSSSDWNECDDHSKGRHNTRSTSNHRQHDYGDTDRREKGGQRHKDRAGQRGSNSERMAKEMKDLEELERTLEVLEKEVELEEEELWRMEKNEVAMREKLFEEERAGDRERRNALDELRSTTRAEVIAYEENSTQKVSRKESDLRNKMEESKNRRYREEKELREEMAKKMERKRESTKKREVEMREELLKEKRKEEVKIRDIMDQMMSVQRDAAKRITSIREEGASVEKEARGRMNEIRREHGEELREKGKEQRDNINKMSDNWYREREILRGYYDSELREKEKHYDECFQKYIQSQNSDTRGPLQKIMHRFSKKSFVVYVSSKIGY